MKVLFYPESIAVIGASTEVAKPGGRVLHYLLKHGFSGAIYPVNPRRSEVQGLRAYPSVRDLPGPVDVAVLAVAAEQTLPALQDCAAAGVRAAVLFASGFAELGPEGRRQQEAITSLARQAGILVIGPNGQGVVNTHTGLTATFSSGWMVDHLRRGRVGFATQSGAVGGMLNYLCNEVGLGLSLWASTGNEAGITVADTLEFMVEDRNTEVIGLYLEDLKDAPTFFRAAHRARERGKPVVVVKGGRSQAGSRAAASHTGALAGQAALYEGAFRQHGVITVDGLLELRDCLYALSGCQRPRGPRLGIVSTSGGIGVMMADRAEALGLSMPEPAAPTVERLRAVMPAYGTPSNPLDTTAGILTDPKLIGRCIAALAEDPEIDMVAVFLGLLNLYVDEAISDISHVVKNCGKPVVVTWLAGAAGGAGRLREAGIVTFTNPLSAMDTLAALARRAPAADRPRNPPTPPGVALHPAAADRARALLAAARSHGADYLSEPEAYAILQAYGIRAAPCRQVRSPGEALAAAEALGYPVVLKGVSRKILHKSDHGLVQVGIATAGGLQEAFRDMAARLQSLDPGASLMVQQQVTGGTELIVGTLSDPQMGPMVMVGTGGLFVEVFRDAIFYRAPVTVEEATDMVTSLKGLPLLKGARGRSPADLRATARLISAVSHLASDLEDQLAELDLNPCLVQAQGEGVIVVDAVVTLKRGK